MSYSNDPFEQMNRMFEQMRRSMFEPSAWDATGDDRPALGAGRAGRPVFGRGFTGVDSGVSLDTTDEGYVVTADLPGFEKEDLSIRFEDGVLTIHGETDDETDTEGVSARRSRRVDERVAVPEAVREDEISASYHNGVLEITLPTDETPEDDSHSIDIE